MNTVFTKSISFGLLTLTTSALAALTGCSAGMEDSSTEATDDVPVAATEEVTTDLTPAQAKGGKGSSGTEGAGCKVISGANSGKTGTYNEYGDCAGSWGFSECKNQDGTDSGKCQDLAKTGVGGLRPPVFGGGGLVRK